MNSIKKIGIKATIIILFGLNFGIPAFTHAQDAIVTPGKGSDVSLNPLKETTRIGSYTPLVQLPGMESVIDPGLETGGAGSMTLPQYIRTLVRIAIGVIGILAVVMIVVSGVQYMGSAMVTEKESARQRLTGAVLGLILAVSSVLLLRTINPQLTKLDIGNQVFLDCVQKKDKDGNLLYFNNYKDISKKTDKDTITEKKGKDGKSIFTDSAGKVVEKTTYVQYENEKCYETVADASTILTPKELEIIDEFAGGDGATGTIGDFGLTTDFYCPKPTQYKSSEIPKIASSFKGRTTYRFGGKGGPPPYPADTKMCEGKACKSFCPEGTACLDCSGFVSKVLTCAGSKGAGGAGTGSIFSNTEIIKNPTDISVSGSSVSINGSQLKPGDVVGWVAGDRGHRVGHRLIYVGSGQFAESHAGNGRDPGNAILIRPLSAGYTKSITRVKRISS